MISSVGLFTVINRIWATVCVNMYISQSNQKLWHQESWKPFYLQSGNLFKQVIWVLT